ncbi:hypothetical protein MesoLjLc_50920 [Mesorhizobium sp. L-8-10]|uniref:hypothetical protein n=1 Tax=Mesorhizobium sp. L-8-10 TaxID=2744523 RepID=UPI001925F02E|nr:hypothetical protein [Mesorhizobium sp. L-8-10]BCH33162.1 hypothetical protein MesoLjLc_50920 [Mesorhizobium sp. L-8-10]
MTDLAERLKARSARLAFLHRAQNASGKPSLDAELMAEAAVEVERLTRERDHWQTAFKGAFETALGNERDRKAAEAMIAALQATQTAKDEALKPFAAIADEYSEQEDDDFQVWNDFDVLGANLPLRHFRAARCAIAAPRTGGKQDDA